MQEIQQRNNNILQILESAISDFCRIYSSTYFLKDNLFNIQFENKKLAMILLEFTETNFNVHISFIIYEKLSLGKVEKLKTFCSDESFVENLKSSCSYTWFSVDHSLIMSCEVAEHYADYDLLKSKILLDIFNNKRNANELRNYCDEQLERLEKIQAN